MKKLTLALIAHDSKRDDMVSLIKAHREELSEIDLIATRDMGEMVQLKTSLSVTLLEDGAHGGDQQVGSLVANGDIRAVIFLCDPLTVQPHEPTITDLLRVCEIHDVPLATNLTTGEAVESPDVRTSGDSQRHHLAAQDLGRNGFSSRVEIQRTKQE